jgi:hypothetical protein
MTDADVETIPAEAPETLERGRYRILAGRPTGFIIARAKDTCERCQNCGCGDQQENLDLTPLGAAKLMRRAREAGMFKGFLPFGKGSHD